MDSIPNYLDNDDDGDNEPTVIETTINSGKIYSLNHNFINTDVDLLENDLDNDDDGDNILTIDEDYNANGDPTDDDTDNSGVPDYLEINVTLSIKSFEERTFKIYPNPTKAIVNLQSRFKISKLSIYYIQGKQILVEPNRLLASKLQFSTQNLKGGLYFIKLESNFKETTIKLIVE